MSFLRFLVIILVVLDGQELNICQSGSCMWTNPTSSQILVCLSTAGSCTVNCNVFGVDGQCRGLIVYNLSPILIVNCDYTDSCKNIKIYCGPFEPPNIGNYGLTSNDFNNANVNTCHLLANSNSFNVGQYAQIHCTGKVSQCYASSTNRGMNDITLYCNGIRASNAGCYIHCQTSNGCNNGTIYCVSTWANCYKTGFVNDVQIKYSISQPPTIYPSRIPTNIPTITPTKLSTKTPFISPLPSLSSLSPTQKPTELPSKSPFITPTLAPTKTPSNFPSNIPTISPIKTNDSNTTLSPTKTPSLTPTFTPTNPPVMFKIKPNIMNTKSGNWIIWAVLLLSLILLILALIYIIYLKQKQSPKTNIVSVDKSSVPISQRAINTHDYSNYYTPDKEGESQTPSNILEGEPNNNIDITEETFPLSNSDANAIISDELIAKEYMLNQQDIHELTKGNVQINEFVTIK